MAIGADQQLLHLGLQPLQHMLRQRPALQQQLALVQATHAPPFPAGQQQAQHLRHACQRSRAASSLDLAATQL